jgi:hypothetical protein
MLLGAFTLLGLLMGGDVWGSSWVFDSQKVEVFATSGWGYIEGFSFSPSAYCYTGNVSFESATTNSGLAVGVGQYANFTTGSNGAAFILAQGTGNTCTVTAFNLFTGQMVFTTTDTIAPPLLPPMYVP